MLLLGRKWEALSHLPRVLCGFPLLPLHFLGRWSQVFSQKPSFWGFLCWFFTFEVLFVCYKSATFCETCGSAGIDLNNSNRSSIHHWPRLQIVLICSTYMYNLISRLSQYFSRGGRYQECMRSTVSPFFFESLLYMEHVIIDTCCVLDYVDQG